MSATSGMPPVTRNTEWRTNNKVLVQVAQTSAASVRMRSIAPPKAEPATRLVFPDARQRRHAAARRSAGRRPEAARPSSRSPSSGRTSPCSRPRSQGNTFKAPAKLKPETEYYWVVTHAAGEVGSGKFRTLSARSRAARREAQARRQGGVLRPPAFALLLQELGAAQEAREVVGAARAGARRPARTRQPREVGAVVIRDVAAALRGRARAAVAGFRGGREPAVAFVTDVKGSATIDGAAQAHVPRRARARGETSLLGKMAPSVTLMYAASGAEFTLEGAGRIRRRRRRKSRALKGAAPIAAQRCQRAPSPRWSRASRRSATASLRMRSLSPASSPQVKPGPLYPRGPIATLQPALRWAGESGAADPSP